MGLSRAGSSCFGSPRTLVNEINQVSARLKHICSRHGSSKWRKIQWPNSGYRDVWRSIENGNGSEPGCIELFWVLWRLVNENSQVSARLKHICSRHGGSKWRRIQWPNSGYRDVWRSIENGNGSEPGWIELFWVPWMTCQ